MTQMTHVTALITAFNEERVIQRAVNSLLSQSLPDIEVCVVDDGSTDATLTLLGEIDDPRLRVLCWGRLGRAEALRRGCEAAKGRYIAILDADDEPFPDRLAKQAAFLDAQPGIAWLGCGEERVDSQRQEHVDRLYPVEDAAIRRMATRCIPYSHSGVMFRRSLINEGINYDAAQKYLIDFEFFIRVANRHKVANLPEVLVRRHVRNESYFQRSFKASLQNRALARLCLLAIWRFRLPPWYAVFPLVRLGYHWVPHSLKRRARRLLGLQETALAP
jgi:glycosyltransferase involved in cell wall biosynthesis